MNILPKKNWHVRNKDNVAKVRRDEAQAAAEEEERLKRHALAEQEARTDLLRQIARKRHGDDSADSQVVQHTPAKHINFFEDLEAGRLKHGTNKEYEAEKKAAQESYEKKIGLLTYLGQSASEAKGTKAWYELPRKSLTEQEIRRKARDDERKGSNDPLNDMVEYVDQKKDMDKELDGDKAVSQRYKSKSKGRHHKDGRPSRQAADRRSSHHPGASSSGSARGRDSVEAATRADDEQGGSTSSSASLARLRAERLRRERAERFKADALLARVRGERGPAERSLDERCLRYNTVYNPYLNKS